jgi:hypothetical protein
MNIAAQDPTLSLFRGNAPGLTEHYSDVGGTERPVNIGQRGAARDWRRWPRRCPASLIPGLDGDPSGYSVLGLTQDQNNTTLNGLDFGGSNIPRDAGVSSSLATAPYDVSRGGFSGGQMNLRTRSGTNFKVRSGSLNLDSPSLQWTDPAARQLAQGTRTFR